MNELSAIKILYVEDEPELRDHIGYALRLHIDSVTTAANGKEALDLIRDNPPDVVLSDVRMPVMDGLELARILRQEFPELPVVLCTAFTDTDCLLKAIDLGVAGYVTKPVDLFRLLGAIRSAVLPILQRRELAKLKGDTFLGRGLIFGFSPAMSALGQKIDSVAGSDYSVVILGEAGTGKSAVAELVHVTSRRQDKPILTVDCRVRSYEQLEAELFGSAPGRGRPAAERPLGTLRDIHGGTIVLDGLEMLPLPLQGRILRLLEEGAYVPSGATVPVRCDLRAIAVSAVDLEKESLLGRFLQGLWLKLSDVVLTVPPLRDRAQDIPTLCRTFLAQAAEELGRRCPEMTDEAVRLLQHERWPGNLRQLKQLARRALLLAGDPISVAGLKPLLAVSSVAPPEAPPSLKLSDLEAWAVREALTATGGKKMQAAQLLGVSYNTFKDKLRRYGT